MWGVISTEMVFKASELSDYNNERSIYGLNVCVTPPKYLC